MTLPRTGRRSAPFAALAAAAALFPSAPAVAHDIDLPVNELARGVARLEQTLAFYQARPVLEGADGPGDHRIALGAAEIDFALGETERALRGLLAELEGPNLPQTSEYVPALLLASEILERSGDDFGAMAYARRALEVGGAPAQMAEAGARWFELSRRWQRLEPRDEVFARWRQRGGEAAADPDAAAAVLYEAAFALRARGESAEARRLLAKVPSGSPHGSRAAYLAGVLFVEDGDLASAERWFAAIMSWPIPTDMVTDAARGREREVRALAALSAARLRYERGDLVGALDAYARVGPGSEAFDEACWEQAFLTLELERPRAAMEHLKCVTDLGAGGKRRIDARLFEASLQAHLGRHAASLELYEALQDQFTREQTLVEAALARIREPSEFLFRGMERSAADGDPALAPGPPTLFADAWTPAVDTAYRVDAGIEQVGGDTQVLMRTLTDYEDRLDTIDAFPRVRFRRQNLDRLLVEIDHLVGHAGELEMTSRASLEVADVGGHPSEHAEVDALLERLRRLRTKTEAERAELIAGAERRLAAAKAELDAVRTELTTVQAELQEIEAAAAPVADRVASTALDGVLGDFTDAAMRAEVGVLDTFWVRKQQRTRAIESLLEQKKETERQMDEALRSARD